MQNTVDNVNRFPENSADEVIEALHSVMHHFRAQRFKGLRDAEFDLTHMETKALGFFARHPAATQRDLVAHSGRDKAQIARLISTLKEKQLLDARANDADRRSVCLHLTPTGQTLWARLHQHALELQSRAIATLSGEECQQLVALLRRIDDNLESPD